MADLSDILQSKTYRIIFFLSTITFLWFFIGTQAISKLIYKLLLKARAKGLVPSFIWNPLSSIALAQGVTIRSIVNNLFLHTLMVIAYECGRPIAVYLYGDHSKTGELHAIWIYKLESFLMGSDLIERRLQIAFGDGYNMVLFFETIYRGGHFYLSVIVYYAALLFASRKTKIYELYMYMIWSCSLTACFIYAIFPCAPPRFIEEARIKDSFAVVLQRQICDAQNDHGGWANCYAAMPSVHSIWCTVTCAMACYHCYFILYDFNRMLSIVGLSVFIWYWVMMHLVIMASGHHWIADFVASWIIMAAYFAFYCNRFKIAYSLPGRQQTKRTESAQPLNV